jgi:hypothetical protein
MGLVRGHSWQECPKIKVPISTSTQKTLMATKLTGTNPHSACYLFGNNDQDINALPGASALVKLPINHS